MLKALWIFLLTVGIAHGVEFNDSHFHLSNYIQEGISIKKFLEIMGNKVGRSTLFGIPLQQQWSERVSGLKNPPKYYLDTDARLYYYSFTDAQIAMTYLSLSEEEKRRFDPMITGFNPTDMYGADHIRRVLKLFPGVFSGIGEFSVHKEFVSSKVAGDVASLRDKALDRILEVAAETGLVVILHNDIDTPFQKDKEFPAYFQQLTDLFQRHPKTTIIWAHTGLGRIIQPFGKHVFVVNSILKNPNLKHVYFDLSWNEVAKYIVSSDETVKKAVELIEKYPDRFLFGTDEVAPKDEAQYYKVYYQYAPLWKQLSKETSLKVRLENYERLFDQAKKSVREWEKKNVLIL